MIQNQENVFKHISQETKAIDNFCNSKENDKSDICNKKCEKQAKSIFEQKDSSSVWIFKTDEFKRLHQTLSKKQFQEFLKSHLICKNIQFTTSTYKSSPNFLPFFPKVTNKIFLHYDPKTLTVQCINLQGEYTLNLLPGLKLSLFLNSSIQQFQTYFQTYPFGHQQQIQSFQFVQSLSYSRL